MIKTYDNGKLFYNPENDRIGIRFNDGTIEDGLHCGQTMEVKINGAWIPTRIEMSDDWYLVGIKGLDSLVGLAVRL
jgi:hypothetical protein